MYMLFNIIGTFHSKKIMKKKKRILGIKTDLFGSAQLILREATIRDGEFKRAIEGGVLWITILSRLWPVVDCHLILWTTLTCSANSSI